ncbi:MAG: homoserine kinase [Cyanobacteria bacterium P01_A01_bin.135]
MPQSTPISVTVPATTANLGPGFDCIGAALSFYNRFTFTPSDALSITATGIGEDRVAKDASNLAYRAFEQFYQTVGQPPPAVQLSIQLGVPLARGLGSSATAIVGGLLGANALAGSPLTQDELLSMAIAIEGHPDNVVPALLGGCQLTVMAADGPVICPIAWHEDIVPIVAVPNFELSTRRAREVLPKSYDLKSAVFSGSRVGLLVRGLETGQPQWLATALQDALHQPHRKALIAGYDAVHQAALDAGAYGLVISGAGPTLLAMASSDQAAQIADAIKVAWRQQGTTATVSCPKLERGSAQVTAGSPP